MNIIPIFANQKILVSYKTTENITLLLRGQVRLPNGEIVDISDSKIVSGVTSGTVTSGTFEKNVPTGELISHTIKTSTPNIQRGQCFVRGDVVYSADSFESAGLFAKYITSESPICLGEFEDSLSGRGFINNMKEMPISGYSATYNNPANILSKVNFVKIFFNASATVANRYAYAYLEDSPGGTVLFSTISNIAITASMQKEISFAPVGISQGITGIEICSLPNNIFFSGDEQLVATVNGAQAGDAISNAYISVEQWIKA